MELQSRLKILLLFVYALGFCEELETTTPQNEPVETLADETPSHDADFAEEKNEPIKTFANEMPSQDVDPIKEENSDYPTRLDIGGFYHNEDHLFGEVDLLLPFIQSNDCLFFGNIRGLDFERSKAEINLGLGFRAIFQDWLFGIYSFYDRKKSEHKNFFSQITAGFEAKTKRFTFDVNSYIPFGKTRKRERNLDQAELRDGDNNFENIWYVQGKEVALWGFDGELGYEIINGVSFFVGGFYFHRKNISTITGPQGRIEVTIDTHKNHRFSVVDRIHLEAGVTYDHVRKSRAYAGMRLSWDLGKRDRIRPKGLHKRMTEYVRRDFNVITEGNNKQPFQRLNNADGSPVTVRRVSNQTQFDLAMTNQAQVIGVEGTVVATGVKTPVVSTAITGGVYKFLDDMEIRLSDFGKFSYGNATLFILNGGVYSFRDLEFVALSPTFELAISNNVQPENILVDNCQFKNATITLVGLDNSPSNIVITNNTFNLDSVTSSRMPLFFNMSSIASASLNVSLVQGNTFMTNLMENLTSFVTVQANVNRSANIQVGDITHNSFFCKDAQEKQIRGITVESAITVGVPSVIQNIAVNSISNNTFEFLASSTKNDVRPIFIANANARDNCEQSVYVKNINHNQIKTNNYTNAQGISVLAEQTLNSSILTRVDHILHNDITYDQTGSQGIGVIIGLTLATNTRAIIGKSGGFFDNSFHKDTDERVDIFIQNKNPNPESSIDVFINAGGGDLSQANHGANVDTDGLNINITK